MSNFGSLNMNIIRFCVLGLLSIHIVYAFDEGLLKHLSLPKPGGILDVLKKPKIPGINIHLSKGGGGFGAGASIGSFGFGFGFGGQYVPPGTGVNLPPQEPQVPDVQPHVPDSKPDFPDIKPHLPEDTAGNGKDKIRPNWGEYEEDDPKDESYGKGEAEYPIHDSYEKDKDDMRPSWEDIGEPDQNDSDSKSENFMNGDLINGGLIQPRLNKKRNKRFIESHVYHVPLLFRSNAKPFQVKVQSNPNSLMKEISEK